VEWGTYWAKRYVCVDARNVGNRSMLTDGCAEAYICTLFPTARIMRDTGFARGEHIQGNTAAIVHWLGLKEAPADSTRVFVSADKSEHGLLPRQLKLTSASRSRNLRTTRLPEACLEARLL